MGWLAEASAEDQAALWRRSLDVLAQLHALDWRGIGLGFLDRPQYGPTGFDQQLGFYAEYLPWAKAGTGAAAARRHVRVAEREEAADLGPPCLTWGDARISNMMYRDFTPGRGARLGDGVRRRARGRPHVVLVPHVVPHGRARHPEPAGLPGPRGTAAIYEEFAKRPLRNLDYFEVWAAFRFGVVMVSIDEVVRQNVVDMPSASMLALSALERTRTLRRMTPLVPHPSTPETAFGVAAGVERVAGGLRFAYRVVGRPRRRARAAGRRRRAHGRLWEHTCFEAFVAGRRRAGLRRAERRAVGRVGGVCLRAATASAPPIPTASRRSRSRGARTRSTSRRSCRVRRRRCGSASRR
jgi:hypothetical protein